ncbi:MAG TPA: ATPase domain-containing protein [Candidatus Nanoarchaeia archaeon]|nr:ATPase domain-containing protein [Candidatus Nanoarchaeia archaeon]
MTLQRLERIPSGIPGFDDLIEGGFKVGSINLLAGSAGSGKTIFSIQFLVEGIKRGEAGVYITFEEKREKLFDDMLEFGWDLQKYEEMGLFKFMEYSPEQIKRVLVEGGGTIDAIITQMQVKRLVIDSITSFALLFQDQLSQKESALALFELINNWGCTALLTSQATQISPDDLTSRLEFEVDSIILLYHFKKQGMRQRALEILKMRGTRLAEKTVKLDIDDHGVKIDPKIVVMV